MSNCCLAMAKHWNVASLVALVLLGCLVWTKVEAQPWKKVVPAQPVQQPQQLQQPQQPQQPQHLPQLPSFPSCEVAADHRIPCGASGISADKCKAINCCFDGHGCYFGRAVTVQVTQDAQFIVVVARDATRPKIDLESISMLEQGPGCTAVDSNSEFAIYQFPVTACGSVVMEEPGVIIYQNRMTSSFEVGIGPNGAVTRDSSFVLLFQGRFTGTTIQSVVAEVLPLQDPPLPVAALGPLSVQLRLANGQCHTKGCNEIDAAYTSFYTAADYPVTKILRDPVFVEVQLLDRTDSSLVLTLGRCWATSDPKPYSLPQWEIITNGCPNHEDRYFASLIPVSSSSGLDFPSHYRRFLFKMFTFVDNKLSQPQKSQQPLKSQQLQKSPPLKSQVYIHCSTSVCQAMPGANCEPSCGRRKRDVQHVAQRDAEPKLVLTVGPVIMS